MQSACERCVNCLCVWVYACVYVCLCVCSYRVVAHGGAHAAAAVALRHAQARVPINQCQTDDSTIIECTVLYHIETAVLTLYTHRHT